MKKVKLILSLLTSAFICGVIGAVTAGSGLVYVGAALFFGSIIVSISMPSADMAYSLCGNIAKGIFPDCAYPLVGGLEVTVYLGNKNDIASYTQNTGNPLIVEGITMKTIYSFTFSGSPSGTYSVGEIVTDTVTSAKGTVISYDGTTLVLGDTTGTFNSGDTLLGFLSGASGSINTVTSSSAKFFSYEGLKTSQEAKSMVAKGKYTTNFEHEVDMVVFNVDGSTKQELDKLARGIVVAIVEYKYKGQNGKAAFEILGLDQGLEVLKLDRDSTNKDTEGAYQVQLKTVAGYTEPHLPRAFFLTDYSTTFNLVKGLL